MKDISIRMSTNGTQRPEALIERVVENFRSFSFGLPLDGIGPRFEYLRHPGKWALVEPNLDYFFGLVDRVADESRMATSITHTVSWHNVFYLHEFNSYIHTRYGPRNIWHNLVYHPTWFNIGILPEGAKGSILRHLSAQGWPPGAWEKVKPLLHHMLAGEPDEREFLVGVAEVKAADAYRPEDFAKTFPEMYDLIKAYFDV